MTARARDDTWTEQRIRSYGVRMPTLLAVRTVRYTSRVTGLPDPDGHTWYVVSLPVALACPGRADLLVVDREVRNPAGTVIGCRGLARVRP